MLGGKKLQKPVKTKFRQNGEEHFSKRQKQKHQDKSAYRLMRREKEEYVLQRYFTEANSGFREENF